MTIVQTNSTRLLELRGVGSRSNGIRYFFLKIRKLSKIRCFKRESGQG